jgi:hypothetical protein
MRHRHEDVPNHCRECKSVDPDQHEDHCSKNPDNQTDDYGWPLNHEPEPEPEPEPEDNHDLATSARKELP